MNTDEHERLSARLCQMWPRKFQDTELADWCQRLDRYRIGDVLQALDDHRNASKFKPQPSEILARLKGKEATRPSAEDRDDTFAQAVRKMVPEWHDCTEAEAVLRYWRQMWGRYSGYVNARRERIPNDHPAQAGLAKTLEGFARHVRVGCVNALSPDLMPRDRAERTVEWVFAAPDQFRLALADVRQARDAQGEVADPFAA